jgi:hypothetical protein
MSRIVFCILIFAVAIPAASQDDVCKKDRSRWILWGQYVQFNQSATNWSGIRESLCHTPYNGFSIHLMSPWGNADGFYPWIKSENGYDLSRLNPKWFEKLREFASEIGGRGRMILSIAFFDRYFESKWNASRLHPFKQNNLGFDWSSSSEPLYESVHQRRSRWNQSGWISWKEERGKLNGREVRFTRIGRSFRAYIIEVITVLNEVKKEYPDLTIAYRVFNEERAKTAEGGSIISGTSLENAIVVTQIVDQLWKEYGTAFHPGTDLYPVLDWVAMKGNDLSPEWARKTNRRVESLNWLQEIHACDQARVKQILAIPRLNPEIVIFSTDGLQPEEDPYFTRQSRALLEFNLQKVDLKVPHKLTGYEAADFERTFEAALPIMLEFINQNENGEE